MRKKKRVKLSTFRSLGFDDSGPVPVEQLRQLPGNTCPTCPARTDKTCDTSCEGRQFLCVRCKKWRPYCFGGSDGLECNLCWVRIRERIVAYIKKRAWRRETTIVYHFELRLDEPTLTHGRVIDILFELVQENRLEWFGAEETKVVPKRAGSTPLKYRVRGK